MALDDNSPNRRNLVLISLSTIAFYLGGAEPATINSVTKEPVYKLALVDVTFQSITHLIVIFWACYIWCLWRYWLNIRVEFSNGSG